MAQNRGKQFENVIRKTFEAFNGVSVDRIHDQTTGFRDSTNICDFIVYRKPYQYYIECKTVHSDYLSIYGKNPKKCYGNITNTQWEGLLAKSKIPGVVAGVLCWWVERDTTVFMPIQFLQEQRERFGRKSIKYTYATSEFKNNAPIVLCGYKKRVFFDYDMDDFFHQVEKRKRGGKL